MKYILVLFLILITFLIVFVSMYAISQSRIHRFCNNMNLDRIYNSHRYDVMKRLGNPDLSAFEIKGFDEYHFLFKERKYAIIITYNTNKKAYHIKCKPSNPKIEIFNHILWH